MLPGSRASRSIDTQRLGQALARPGMDTRCWVCEAVVKKFKLDSEEGPFADVVILPSQEPDTVRVGAFYAGPGFGLYAPLEKDDHVLVSYPNGDPDQGGVIVARLWSASDEPPQLAKDHDGDVCLHVKKDVSLRIQVFGSGNVVVGAEDGKVLLGDESGTSPVARKDDKLTASGQMAGWASVVETAINGLVPGTFTPSNNFAGPPSPTPGPANPGKGNQFGSITEGSDKVEAS